MRSLYKGAYISYAEVEGGKAGGETVALALGLACVAIALLVAWQCWARRPAYPLYAETILSLLQEANIPWCFILLDAREDGAPQEERGIFYSQDFLEVLQSAGAPAGTGLSWGQLVRVFGASARSAFQQGIRHVLRFGGDFSCTVDLPSGQFLLEGRLSSRTPYYVQSALRAANVGGMRRTWLIADRQRTGVFLVLTNQTRLAQQEKALNDQRRATERAQAMLDALPAPIWSRRADGKIDSCNAAYAKLLATWPAQVVANQWEIVESAQLHRVRELHKKALEGGGAHEADVLPLRQIGSKELHVITRAISVAKRKPSETVSIAMDFSKEHAQLAHYEALSLKYQQALARADSAFMILSSDGAISLSSAKFSELFGLEADWLEQHSFCNDLLERLRDTRKLPEYINFAAIKEQFARWLRERGGASELWHLPNGHVLNLTPCALGKDETMITFRDVSESLQLERTYKSLLAVHMEMVEHSHEAMLIVGTDHRIKHFSRCTAALLGVDADAFIGGPLKDFLERFSKENGLLRWQEKILMAVELRNRKTEYVTLLGGRVLQCEYLPLPDGGHLLSFFPSPGLAAADSELFAAAHKAG